MKKTTLKPEVSCIHAIIIHKEQKARLAIPITQKIYIETEFENPKFHGKRCSYMTQLIDKPSP